MINDFFDVVYCINLERRTDRKTLCIEHFEKIGIEVEFFSGVDGALLSNVPKGINKGEYGCILSHRAIYEDAKNRGLKKYLILEDDCEFHPEFSLMFSEFIKKLPSDWRLLYFGGNHNGNNPEMITENLHRLKETYTTHCYGVNSRYFNDIIMDTSNDNRQIDVSLSEVQKKYPCYGFMPHLAWQRDGYSDIINRETDYKFLRTHGDPRRNN